MILLFVPLLESMERKREEKREKEGREKVEILCQKHAEYIFPIPMPLTANS